MTLPTVAKSTRTCASHPRTNCWNISKADIFVFVFHSPATAVALSVHIGTRRGTNSDRVLSQWCKRDRVATYPILLMSIHAAVRLKSKRMTLRAVFDLVRTRNLQGGFLY